MTKDPIGFDGGDVNLYAYVGNNPIDQKDPSGLWAYSGNYCGPDWTGGKKESYTPGHKYTPATNALDSCCSRHDKCYYICRKASPCDSNERGKCMRKCDRALAKCSSNAGNKYSEPLWWWMEFNDNQQVGPDAKDCCKK
ncbi:MAG: hypothetical protein CVU55_09670 [Deltaproteobacteria bacterium HGW-Deltaproteobacteria-13]|jgi:uncharacterized protein RhaS with RHS repeats|nr:MAG: hypothetical protein CVU55_09670 [Deltaproteobacteria bacterium HGW-Deltaproteobacteria-13]